MQCRCGNTINNVPEHLRDLATWICQKCTNTAPKAQLRTLQTSEDIQVKEPEEELVVREEIPRGRRRKAA